MKQLIKKGKMLIDEMLPYIQKFKGKIVVIKYGGNAMINDKLKSYVMKDIALLSTLGINPIIVHGGGPEITKQMKKKGIEPKFLNGLRVTDEKIINIIRKVFKKTNKEIQDMLSKLSIRSKSLEDCIFAKQKSVELCLVGEITGIDKEKIKNAVKKGVVPVISPLGKGNGVVYNINADTAATKIAIALKAEKLTVLTNVDGVMEDGKFISHLSINDALDKIKNQVITAGMIPKVEACIEAVESGCKKAHLINGTIEHSLLFEIFTDKGIGTEIVKNGN